MESGKGKVESGEGNIAEEEAIAKGKHVSWKTTYLETKYFLEAKLYNLKPFLGEGYPRKNIRDCSRLKFVSLVNRAVA